MRIHHRHHDRHERHDRPHEGRGRRERRLFEHGDLRLLIAALLAEKPRYGYEIIKEIEDRVGGGYSPSPGVVYPTLTLLEELGHATVSEGQGGRKLYTLSPEGEAALATNRAAADAILSRIDATAGERRGPPHSVQRALENLHTAVRLRLKGREATPDQVRAIAEAIDAAARKVDEA